MHFLTFVVVATAFQFPSWLPFVYSVDPQAVLNLPSPEPSSERIAIIGAGAAGSSAAFWLARAKERHGLDIEVDIFEKTGLVGGSEYAVLCLFCTNPCACSEVEHVDFG